MEKGQVTSKNLQRLSEEAGITLKALQKLYISNEGKRSASMVYQHWFGRRAIAWKAAMKYSEIFKQFGMNVTPQDFYQM
jgi:hypothetical protein